MLRVDALILVLSFLFPPFEVLASSHFKSESWSQVEIRGLNKAWVNPYSRGQLISFVRLREGFPLSFKGKLKNEISSGLAGMREATLSQFGFSSWKLKSFEYQAGPESEVIFWSGSYRRPDGSLVQFIEHQYYVNNYLDQFTFTFEGSAPLTNPKDVESFLEQLWKVNQRYPASKKDLEGGICEFCHIVAEPGNEISETANEILDLTKSDEMKATCSDEKSFLFDPEQKSILEELGIPVSTKEKFPVLVGRGALSCFFGAGAGAYGSLRDLVMAVPTLLGLGWKTAKKTDFSGILDNISPRNLWNSAKKSYEVTTSSINSAYRSSTELIYNSYQAGGVMGSISAVAEAANRLRPSKVIGPFLAKTGAKIAEVVSQEWRGFKCMPPEVMVETVCKVFSYIATDIVTGKLALSALQDGSKIASALKSIRAKAERLPGVGSWLTKDVKHIPSDNCKAVSTKSWMKDSNMSIQGNPVDVALHDGKAYGKMIDGNSGSLACFEIVGKTFSNVEKRVEATKTRTVHSPTSVPMDSHEDVFSSMNSKLARTNDEFISQVSHEAGVKVSAKSGRSIAKNLESDPDRLEEYGQIMRSTHGIRRKLNQASKKDPNFESLSTSNKISEELAENIQDVLAKSHGENTLNLRLINTAYNEALQTGNSESLKILSQSIKTYRKVSGNDHEKSVSAWRLLMRRENPHVNEEALDEIGQCLFSNGIK